MKHLILPVILLTLSPLSWGENVWYCQEDQKADISIDEAVGVYRTTSYLPERFTFKHEPDKFRLAVKGRTWGGDHLYYLECGICYLSQPFVHARSSDVNFKLVGDRFFMSKTTNESVSMASGTCAKF